MLTRKIKVAVGQMLVVRSDVQSNLARAESMIRAAHAEGCQVVVLPECLDLGWTDPDARQLAEPIPGPRSEQLGKLAARYQIIVAAGLTERSGELIYNSAVLLDHHGALLLCHRKINVLSMAQDLYEIGNQLHVARTHAAVIGVDICADNFPNTLDIGGVIHRLGAQLLLSPSAWAVDADFNNDATPYGSLWLDAYRQLATECQMPIIGASNIGAIRAGPWAGRRCIGCSLIVDSDGQLLAQGPADQESLVVAEVTVHEDQPLGTDISGML